jgi:hypothetical protein
MELKVIARNIYGELKYYPDNENAKMFAEIANTRTLSKPVLTRAAALGFDVTCRIEADGAVADFPLVFIQKKVMQ